MRRRTFLSAISFSPWLNLFACAGAHSAQRRPKLAVLAPSAPAQATTPGSSIYAFLSALTELGYIDRQSISIEFRFADNRLERLPALAAELIAAQPDVLWTWTSAAAVAAAAATKTIPIVIAPVSEVTMSGLVPDFARPSGNVTGLTNVSLALDEKGLELLKEALPRLTRIGVVINPLSAAWKNYPEVLRKRAQELSLELIGSDARNISELDQAFASLAASGVEALLIVNDNNLLGLPFTRAVELATDYRLPTVSAAPHFARAGGFLSISTNDIAIARAGAFYVHRIIQGARPNDLPIQLPIEFPIILNLKAAKSLGVDVPTSLLVRADEVLE